MSHELRTPLNAIIGFSELMHDGKVGPVSADHKEYLGDILMSSRHLLQLINDVLDLAKVESGKMEFRPEPVDVPRIVDEVRDVLRDAGRREAHPDRGGGRPARHRDRDRSRQAQAGSLQLPLQRAQVHSRRGPRPRARRPEGEDELRIEVEDTGIGIRTEDIDRLFVEFQQLDASTAKKYPGTGLGLALTKRIVEDQGGRVGVQSAPDRGSVFFAVLPRVAAGAPATREDRATALPGSPRVLVIEDDRKDREWLVQSLARGGYAADAVATGAEGIARGLERSYDAITLDLLLPDLSPGEVLGRIRSGERNRNTPVIVASVIAEKGSVAGVSVHEVLQKPIQYEELLAALDRAVAAHGPRHRGAQDGSGQAAGDPVGRDVDRRGAPRARGSRRDGK